MNVWASLSVLSLSTIIALCIIGLIHKGYKDNLLQCIGIGGAFLFGISQVNAIWHSGVVDDPSVALLYLSVALFGIGTAIKVTIHHGRESGWEFIIMIDKAIAERKTAAGEFDSKPHQHS